MPFVKVLLVFEIRKIWARKRRNGGVKCQVMRWIRGDPEKQRAERIRA